MPAGAAAAGNGGAVEQSRVPIVRAKPVRRRLAMRYGGLWLLVQLHVCLSRESGRGELRSGMRVARDFGLHRLHRRQGPPMHHGDLWRCMRPVSDRRGAQRLSSSWITAHEQNRSSAAGASASSSALSPSACARAGGNFFRASVSTRGIGMALGAEGRGRGSRCRADTSPA